VKSFCNKFERNKEMEEDYSYRFYIDSLADEEDYLDHEEYDTWAGQEDYMTQDEDTANLEKRYVIWLQDQSLRRDLTEEEIAVIQDQIAKMYPVTRELNDERETPVEVSEYDCDEA
jgi:hypothetical protein